jgi:hypothetical protein
MAKFLLQMIPNVATSQNWGEKNQKKKKQTKKPVPFHYCELTLSSFFGELSWNISLLLTVNYFNYGELFMEQFPYCALWVFFGGNSMGTFFPS